jgi:antitoxin ParD1/3/4
MNISLTPELESQIARRVEAGDYASPSDVVRDALGRLFAEDVPRAALVAKLNAEINAGLAELDRGEGIPGHEIRAEFLTHGTLGAQ